MNDSPRLGIQENISYYCQLLENLLRLSVSSVACGCLPEPRFARSGPEALVDRFWMGTRWAVLGLASVAEGNV